MTREERELLITDLSCRLPYGLKIHINGEVQFLDSVMYDDGYYVNFVGDNKEGYALVYNDIQPYLYPMSSMTEEQKNEYYDIVNYISSDDTDNWQEGEFIYVDRMTNLLHFYHRNHIDYRGLIPMGLARDATGLKVY